MELNGDKPVSAAFVVGGGGKLPGFTQKLAGHLDLPPERVALRGEEVLGFVNIFVEGVKKDPLLVTPIGICLNFYDQKNRFVYLLVNDERIKLYDNDKLTVFDAALAYGLSNDSIFPKRGADLNYTLNGKKKFIRGSAGEAATILLNGKETGMNHAVKAGDQIKIVESTKGEDAAAVLNEVTDVTSTISFVVNEVVVNCPRYASVNGHLESEFYHINDGDKIEVLNYYTLSQLMQFMDIETPHEVFVNGARAGADTKIYENFNVAWIDKEDIYKTERFVTEEEATVIEEKTVAEEEQAVNGPAKNDLVNQWIEEREKNEEAIQMNVVVNGEPVTLTGKSGYVFVDIFDKYDFDLRTIKGTTLVQKIDGQPAEHFSPLHNGAVVELYWKE